MYNWVFDLAGLALLLMTLVLYESKPHNQIHVNRLLPVLLIFAAISTLTDLFYGLWVNDIAWYNAHVPHGVAVANNYLYYIFHFPSIVLFYRYLMDLCHIKDANETVHWTFWAPSLFLWGVLALNPLTGWVFKVAPDGTYFRGPLVCLWYIGISFYVINAFYLLITKKKRKKAFVSLVFFLSLAVLGTIIQMFVPSFLAENYSIDLSIFFVFISLQRIEEVTIWETGLFNRASFASWCDEDYKRGLPFSLILVSIADGAALNTTLGEHSFLNVKKEIAACISKYSRWAFSIREYVFAIKFVGSTVSDREEALRELEERFKKPWVIDGEEIDLKLQLLPVECPKDFKSNDELLDIVIAMTTQQFPDTVLKLEDLDLQKANRRKLLNLASRTCCEKKRLDVVYQPIYSVNKRKFVSAEALVRLKDPVLGQVRPDELISVAEQNGSIVPINAQVREMVLDLVKRRKVGCPIHVNLSMTECMQDYVIDDIIRQPKKAGINPSMFCLELTETATAFLPAVAKENLNRLHKAGFTLYLDDFGQGQANMDHLINSIFSIVKLDRIFVTSEFGRAIRPKYIQLCKSLGKKVLLEGVETKEEADAAIAEGVDYIQGFYYSKPLSEEGFLSIMGKQELTV